MINGVGIMKNIKKIKETTVENLKKAFPLIATQISADGLCVLHEGRMANATVLRYRDESMDLTVKDFSGSPFIVRAIYGVLSTRAEYRAKKALKKAMGGSCGLYRLSPCSVAFDFVGGSPLNSVPQAVPSDYFVKMEKIVEKLHESGFVHLDLRNLGNMILCKDGTPYIIDFQSCLPTKHMPAFLRRYLEKVDFSGIYKAWEKKCSVALDLRRKKELDYVNGIRKFWVFRGYPLQHFLERMKRKMR